MKKEQNEYIEKLENVVRQLIAPLRDVPPELLLELLTDEKGMAKNPQNKKLVRKLKKRLR